MLLEMHSNSFSADVYNDLLQKNSNSSVVAAAHFQFGLLRSAADTKKI